MPAPAARRRAACVVALVASAACSSDQFVDPGSAPAARAFGIWTPGPFDSCTKEQHDAYAVLGPDGKVYPTWHPPTGPGGCSFGHEHGRDPRGSDLYGATDGLPFGVANEMLALSDPANPRDEDHFGHKVEWENDIDLDFRGAGSAIFKVKCDVLTKFHQGTHSKDAFTNNVHELVYHIRCDNGTRMGITMLTAIGRPGEFVRSCDRNVHVQAGAPTPANSPEGGGFRAIPDRACVEAQVLVPEGQSSNYRALHETWETSNSVRRADGHTLAHFNPYFQVRLPSRFHDPALAPVVGRPIDVCYEATADRRTGQRWSLQLLHRRRADPGRHLRRPTVPVQRGRPLRGHQRQPHLQLGRPRGVVHRRLRAERQDGRVSRLGPSADLDGGQ